MSPASAIVIGKVPKIPKESVNEVSLKSEMP